MTLTYEYDRGRVTRNIRTKYLAQASETPNRRLHPNMLFEVYLLRGPTGLLDAADTCYGRPME